jgi:basic amino acid/polyamine antiporter, APA family
VFFAFIGFDIVATNAEETKKPQRDLPIGIFCSLAICAVLYVAVSVVITGMVKYNRIDVAASLATAFQQVGQNTIATIVAYGAPAGITSVIYFGYSVRHSRVGREGDAAARDDAERRRRGVPVGSTGA